MNLSPGDQLGPFKIAGALGAGGMGEVYRAQDTTLNRAVALKILPDLFASDPDRLARFSREAQTLAALNHPNIAQIYGVHDGVHNGSRIRALVMEFVDGDDLSRRLAAGPFPVPDALAMATQIAEALETAHEQGIIHRDLKPANIKQRPDGAVKVLDFGLAKAMESGSGIGDRGLGGASLSPTITSPALMTGVGMLLGTAAYMSPEQAKGRAADKRSDIWAFGCVLFEMLTGRPPFTGETVTEVLASVMKDAPALDTLPADTPVGVRQLLGRCLERDPKQRLRDIGEARITIAASAAAARVPHATPPAAVSSPAATSFARPWLPWTIAATAVVVAAIITLLWAPWREATPAAPLRLSTALGVDASLVTNIGAAAVLAPDGTLLAFVAQPSAAQPPQLYLRPLSSLQATAITGTANARDPFFSPDGQWIAFFADGKLKKVAVAGGAAVTIADALNARGGTWAEDDTIVFQPVNAASPNAGSLMRVPSSGGTPEQVIPLDGKEVTQRWPQVLPGGAVLFTSHVSTTLGYEDATIVAQMPGGERKILVRGGYFARYLPSGHIVYIHLGTLFAAPLDVRSLALTGPAVPVVEGITTNASLGGAQFSVADNGTLVYLPGEVRTRFSDSLSLISVDRAGKSTTLRSMPAPWSDLQFSPDGNRLAASLGSESSVSIWILDTAKDILSRLTFEGEAQINPAWSADGGRIAYVNGQNDGDIYWRRADGAGIPQRMTTRTSSKRGLTFHPNGTWLAFSENDGKSKTIWDVMLLPLEDGGAGSVKVGQPTPFLADASSERYPSFSPDGRWIAYTSDETGMNEVYVRPFPGPGGKWQISTGGGAYPAWSKTKAELIYETATGGDVQLMSAGYSVKGDAFIAERARPWTSAHIGTAGSHAWALHPDGAHVAGTPPQARTFVKQDTVVLFLNFFDEVRRRTNLGP